MENTQNSCEQIEVIVKHTFLEFRSVDAETSRKTRRRLSDSALFCGEMCHGMLKGDAKENVPLSQNGDVAKQMDNGIRSGAIADNGAGDGADAHNTTLILRDFRGDISQSDLVAQLTEDGYRGQFDFVYMPINFRNGGNFGYAFVNFVSNHAAVQVMRSWSAGHGSSSLGMLACSWSSSQGFAANVDRYRNSPLMHASVPMDCKPAAFDSSGNRARFPKPTETIVPPRARVMSILRSRTKPQGKP